MDRIDSFKEEHRFLSNFYQTPVNYKGLVYPNGEAAFQAQKCSNEEDKVKYTLIKNPVRAKQMGKKEPNLPANWGELSLEVMLGVLRAKFAVPEMAEKLLATTGCTASASSPLPELLSNSSIASFCCWNCSRGDSVASVEVTVLGWVSITSS